ncbi:lysozyme [Bordetella flabilis]|uniref:Lysozyme n=1 Tax=Bordetella flabilis TaxID=463014 RepID=A0A193GBH4_9BORD|nr:lysozyme [Bordetella flabilis]ANN76811.1 lysozyme [Bordetella flabilis]
MIPDALKRALQTAAAGAGALAIAGVLVSHFEGRKHFPYRDPIGYWTVCEGHTGGVTPGRRYSDAECDALKAQDLAEADAAVRRLVKVPLTDWQRAALIDFTFNLGAGNLAKSTLLKKLNAGDYAGACAEYDAWVKGRVAGRLQTLPGLQNRRDADQWVCEQSSPNPPR